MQKGYTIVKQDKNIKKSIHEIDQSKKIEVELHDGSLKCEILEKVVK
jgi:exonuclease VII large subunit